MRKNIQPPEELSNSLDSNNKTKIFVIVGVLTLFLLISLVFNFLLLKKSESNNVVDKTQNYLLATNLSQIEKKDRIIHFAPLKTDITEYINTHKNLKMSVYFEYLVTGANFSINVDLNTFPGSLTKVPIAILILDKVEKGKLSLDQKLEILDSFKDNTSGDLYKVPNGTTMTIKDLLEESLVHSDNTAKNILYSLTDSDDMNILVDELGMDKLFNTEGKTTTKEYSRFFRSLYYSSMLPSERSQYILELLSKSNRSKYMADKIPNNIVVSHKYASLKPDRSYSDVGIVYIPNRPFILAVSIDGRDANDFTEDQAKEIISTIAKKAYDYLSK